MCSSAAAPTTRAPRQLLGVGRGRAPVEARARPSARHHVPLARPREGRGRPRRRGLAAPPGRGRSGALRRPRHRRDRRRALPTRAPLRRRSRADRDRPPGGRSHALLARRPGGGQARPRRRPGAPCCCSSVGSSRSRAPTSRSRALAELADHRAVLVLVGGPSGPEGEEELARLHTLVDELGLERASGSSHPSRTSSWPASTRPPTCASCPRGASRSASWRSRRRRAAPPSSRRTSGGCGSSSTTASPACSSTTATRAHSPMRSSRCCTPIAGVDVRRRGPARVPGSAGASPRARLRRHYARSRRSRTGAVQLTDHDLVDLDAAHDARRDAPGRAGCRRRRTSSTWSTTRSCSRWYVRFTCDGRDATTIYFDLHQRTLRYEVYFLPIPPRTTSKLCTSSCCAANHTMYGARFSIGPDGDLYLVGPGGARAPDASTELDRIIGVLYELIERGSSRSCASPTPGP